MGEVFYWSGRQAPQKVKSLTGVQLSSLTAGSFEIVAVDKSCVIHYLGDNDAGKRRLEKIREMEEKQTRLSRVEHLRLETLKLAEAERNLLQGVGPVCAFAFDLRCASLAFWLRQPLITFVFCRREK